MKKTIAHGCVTLGYLSYYVLTPGTVASALAMFSIGLAAMPILTYTGVIFGSIVVSYFLIRCALSCFNHKDPSVIVLDECVGMLIALYGVPYSPVIFCLGFLLFRFFDITKIGIVWLEKLPGAYGILADDIAAGLLANSIVHILVVLGIIA